jgi:iron(III) transport system ATP-binding protein
LSALDAQVRVSLRAEIRRLQKHLGITTLMVTHDQDEALAMSDRVVVMHKGQIEQIGTPQQLYAWPASAFVAGFVGKMNLMPALVVARKRARVGTQDLHCDIEEFKTGSPLLLGLRPEAIRLRAFDADEVLPADERLNALRAEVLETVFLGHCTLVRLRCAALGEAVIEAELPTSTDASLPGWLQGQVLMELPATSLRGLVQPLSTLKAA